MVDFIGKDLGESDSIFIDSLMQFFKICPFKRLSYNFNRTILASMQKLMSSNEEVVEKYSSCISYFISEAESKFGLGLLEKIIESKSPSALKQLKNLVSSNCQFFLSHFDKIVGYFSSEKDRWEFIFEFSLVFKNTQFEEKNFESLVSWWRILMENLAKEAVNSTDFHVRAILFDSLSNIQESVFNRLDVKSILTFRFQFSELLYFTV